MDFESFNSEGISYVGSIDLPKSYDPEFKPTQIQRQIELSVTNGRGYESFGEAFAVAGVELAKQGIIPSFSNALETVPVNNLTRYRMIAPCLYDPGFTIEPIFTSPEPLQISYEEQMTLVERIKLNAIAEYNLEKNTRESWNRVKKENPELFALAFKVG